MGYSADTENSAYVNGHIISRQEAMEVLKIMDCTKAATFVRWEPLSDDNLHIGLSLRSDRGGFVSTSRTSLSDYGAFEARLSLTIRQAQELRGFLHNALDRMKP